MTNNTSVPPSRENVIHYQEKKETFENRYLKLNKTLLSAVAMWPSPDTWFKRTKIIILGCLYVFCLVVQLAPFVTNDYSIDLFIEVISFIIPTITIFMKFLTFFMNSDKLTRIFENIERDWQSFEKQIELNILKQYAAVGRRYTLIGALTVYVGMVMFTLTLLAPDFLDLIIPLNKTREHNFPFTVEYFIDQEKYFHFILLNTIIVLVMVLTILIASETLLVVLFQHAFGLFRITSYRMEHVFDNVVSKPYSVDDYRNRIIEAVNLHTRAIKYIEHCMDVFLLSYDILAVFGVASLSLNLFLVYNSQWYSAHVTLQKYVPLVMRQSMKFIHVVLGGIFVPSLEGFTTITNLSISYFMVIYTTRS